MDGKEFGTAVSALMIFCAVAGALIGAGTVVVVWMAM